MKKYTLRVCIGGQCRMNFSQNLLKTAQKAANKHPNVKVEPRSCLSECEKAPNIEVINTQTEKTLKIYNTVGTQEINPIFKHLLNESAE